MGSEVVAGQSYSFSIIVEDAANEGIAKANPTLDATNDFLISINGAAWDTLDNSPVVSPAGSEFIDITFSDTETTAAGDGGYIKLRVADAAGDEWIGAAYRYDVRGAVLADADDVTAITSAIAVIDTVVDAILDDTGTDGVAIATNAIDADALASDAVAEINATVDTALSDVGLTATVTSRIDAAISSRSSHSAADVWSAVTRTLTANTNLNDPTAAAVADAVLDELLSGHATAGSLGKAMSDVLADTDELQTDWANGGRLDDILDATATEASVGALNNLSTADIDARLVAYDAATGAEASAISAAIAALNNLAASEVWVYASRTLTGTAASQTSPVAGSTLNITRSATFTADITGLSEPASWDRAKFTVKRVGWKSRDDAASALLQIDTSDGLTILNQSTAGLIGSDADLSITDGTATITIADHVTQQIAPGAYSYDIKFYTDSDSSSVVATEATCNVATTPTETV